MYPGSIFNWHDQSVITGNTLDAVDNSPLYLHVSSFNRGPEDLRVVSGKMFYDLYGTKMDFDRNGQPAIQAANIIDGGGRLLLKRLVAEDALLANSIGVATVMENINAVKVDDAAANGKTVEEILTGVAPVAKTYPTVLEITSAVGASAGKTALTVTNTKESGNIYLWRVTETEMMPALGTKVTAADYTEWDGTANITIPDGTKIELIEYNSTSGIVKFGIIKVVSAAFRSVSNSLAPKTGLNALYATSSEGTTTGNSKLTVSPAKTGNNVYRYRKLDAVADQALFVGGVPDLSNPALFTIDLESANEVVWDGSSEITIADGTYIVLTEVTSNTDPKPNTVVKGAVIKVVSKLATDTRTSSYITPVKPTVNKYIVSNQTNSIKWTAVSITNCKSYDEVMTEAAKLYTVNAPVVVSGVDSLQIVKSTDYPLIIATDNGRGVSSKSIKFVPDYTTSKDMENMFYTVYIYEGTTLLETCVATLNPDAVFSNTLYGLNADCSIQVKFGNVAGIYNKYIAHLAEITGYTAAVLNRYDCLFVTNNKGAALSYISLDAESVDFGSAYGVEIQNGSNGVFEAAPFGTTAWINSAIAVFNGTFDDSIWDTDTYKISAVFDANYPETVKDEIAKFVTFREDCCFFRDYGIEISSYAAIVNKYNSIDGSYKNKFNLDYYTTYQIYDPETKVRETVTMMYDLARAMVSHFSNGVYRPMAGVVNNMILSNAIEGTVNFTPRITPTVNQKALLDDLRINYAIFEEGRCVVQSLYTSQSEWTQLSYGNNVLAIQEVIRAVRVSCPKQRYTFTSGSDFSSYADAVNNVLKSFSGNFAELKFGYEESQLKGSQKIFYASIYFRFNNWAQTESFDIYALPNA